MIRFLPTTVEFNRSSALYSPTRIRVEASEPDLILPMVTLLARGK